MADPGTPPQKECMLPAPAVETPITLQIGERRFVTTHDTLTQESGFFASLLSGRWDNTQADGSYFIDADADLFVHILHYLRRGVLPIFYDASRGHDHALYLALLVEARYFQIPRLEAWLKEERYLQAIKLDYSAEAFQGVYTIAETSKTGAEIQHHPQWHTRKVYVCPCGVMVHRGDPQACGKLCFKARGDEENQYEDEEVWKP
jgi:BTB/POZ domain-containing protein KCTD9